MTKEIIVVIGFLFIAGLVLGVQLHKNKSKKIPLQKLKEFIESDEVKNSVEDIICNVLYQTDFSKYNSFMDAQADIFKIAYDEIWKHIQIALQEHFGEDKLYSAILKVATRNLIEDYTNSVFLSENIQEQLTTEMQIQIDNETEDILKEEQQLEKEAEEYEKDDYSPGYIIEELDPTKIDGKDDGSYNEPTEDEEEYNEDDDSIEVVNDDKTEINLDISVEVSDEEND